MLKLPIFSPILAKDKDTKEPLIDKVIVKDDNDLKERNNLDDWLNVKLGIIFISF